MKQHLIIVLICILGLAACAAFKRDMVGLIDEEIAQTLAPVDTNAVWSSVRIVSERPEGCTFKGGISGLENGGEPGRTYIMDNIENRLTASLKQSAQRMGGNVVYLSGAYMGKPEVSNDYLQEFYINGVQYGGLVYACP